MLTESKNDQSGDQKQKQNKKKPSANRNNWKLMTKNRENLINFVLVFYALSKFLELSD